ncbi:MFS transporter [bacterium]|nr:MFS transporter [bacterium]
MASPSISSPRQHRWFFMVRALVHRNFRLFFIGQTISFMGTWMQQVAMGWLVWRLTHNPAWNGTVVFCAQVPVFFLGPASGFVADRFNRQRAILVTQSILMVQALALAALTLTNVITIPHIISLAILLGIANAFDLPLRQSFYIHMVGKEDLSNAIALNSIMANGARMFGPSIAGLLLFLPKGDGICFLLNGVSYIGALWAIMAMRNLPAQAARGAGKSGKSFLLDAVLDIQEGFNYAMRSTPIRSLLAIVALVSFAGMPYVALMPMIVDKVLHGSGHTLGYLTAIAGIGTFGAALFLASRRGIGGLDRAVASATLIFSVSLIVLGLSHWIWLSALALIGLGYSFIVQVGSSNTIIQTIVNDAHRGRIMSFFTMSFLGVSPFGSLLAGFMARHMGAASTLLICGLCCLAGGLYFTLRLPRLRLLAGTPAS